MLTLALAVCLSAPPAAPPPVEAVLRDYGPRVEAFFEALDLSRPGLEGVQASVDAGDLAAASHKLLAYYRQGDSAAWLRAPVPQPGAERLPAADAVLERRMTFYNTEAQVPLTEEGRIDWSYNGPEGDREWGWALNRHGWLLTLLNAFQKTGNREYARGLDRMLYDWLAHRPPYPGQPSASPEWRGLEVHFRVQAWSRVFYALQDVPEFSNATRLLLLADLPKHAHYLRNFHAGAGNWVTMEMNGLATAALCWPELARSEPWSAYAMARQTQALQSQVYPDGAQMELTCHYHCVSLGNFEEFLALYEYAGEPVPPSFRQTIKGMYQYLFDVVRPSLRLPLNNDSDLLDLRPRLRNAPARFHAPDWAFIASNGAEGHPPKGPPSRFAPFAGHLAMRNGFTREAQWGFFDIGPRGIGHDHSDMLHLSVSAGGRDLLVDSGRFTYHGGRWRDYFVSAHSHNTVLLDGHGQTGGPPATPAPLSSYRIEPGYDAAWGAYDGPYGGLEGTARHTRWVAYVRGAFWLVVDRIESDRPREITALWHFHPDCALTMEDGDAVTTDAGQTNLRIAPLGAMDWRADVVKGRTEPEIQGWYSREYGVKEPAPCAVFRADASESWTTFGWLLLPREGTPPRPQDLDAVFDDAGVRVEMTREGGERAFFVFDLRAGRLMTGGF